MTCPYYIGKFTLKYVDANVNTSNAQPVWFGTAFNYVTITPVPLSGDATPVTIPWGNVTTSGGVITAISLTTPTPVTFPTATYQAAGIQLGTAGTSTFVGSVRCSGGVPVGVDIHCGGSGFFTPQTIVIYGTTVASGNDITAQFDIELNGSQTQWSPGIQLRTANKSGTWAISNPRVMAPAGNGGVPNITSPASQLSTAPHILAALTAANGRPIRRIRYMDRTSEQGSNLVLPSDYTPTIAKQASTNNRWRTLNSNPGHGTTFRFARLINTNPAKGPGPTGDGTYAGLVTKLYTCQPWAQFFDSTFTLSVTTTSGSPVVACATMVNGSASALMTGSSISGTGIPSGSYVAYFGFLTSGTSTNASTTITGIPHADAVTISALLALGNLDIVLAANTNALSIGIPNGAQITAVDTTLNTLTLSAAATVTGPTGITVGDNLCFTLGGNTPPNWALPTATASGTVTMTVQNPGYITPPTSDMGYCIQNNFGSNAEVVCEPVASPRTGLCGRRWSFAATSVSRSRPSSIPSSRSYRRGRSPGRSRAD